MCPIYRWSSLGRWWKWCRRSGMSLENDYRHKPTSFIFCHVCLVCGSVVTVDRVEMDDLSGTVKKSRWGSLWFRIGELHCKLEAQRQISRHEEAVEGHRGHNKSVWCAVHYSWTSVTVFNPQQGIWDSTTNVKVAKVYNTSCLGFNQTKELLWKQVMGIISLP